MPTSGEMYTYSPERKEMFELILREASRSWTDDLLVCRQSGVGFSTNVVYREDGYRHEGHEFEDRMFHFRSDDDRSSFYGVFDGHDGVRAAEYARQKMPAEVFLGQLKECVSDEEVRQLLLQTFYAVEKGFLGHIGDKLAEKVDLEMRIQDLNLTHYEACKHCPEIVSQLQSVMAEISGGTTAVVALIVNNKLYVANVGDSRALLCRVNEHGNLEVIQLSVDHNLENEDELLRLSQIGLDIQKLRNATQLGNQENTRCIGNYGLKGGYKDYDVLRSAREEPIIAEPEIVGGIPCDDSFRFLLLMSDGLYHSLVEATGTTDPNSDISHMVLKSFAVERSLHGVAQAVVNQVVNIHRDTFMNGGNSLHYQKRDDITLLVRTFNKFQPGVDVRSFFPGLRSTLSVMPPHDVMNSLPLQRINISQEKIEDEEKESLTSTVVESTSGSSSLGRSDICLDEEGRIEAYVDFQSFYSDMREAFNQHLVSEDWCCPSS